METVPDIVQLTDDEADHEKQQHAHCAELVPQLHLGGSQVQESKHHGADAAVYVGQTLLPGRLDAAAHIARHLTHGVQKTSPGVFIGDVQPEALGELVDTGLGGLQCRIGGKLQKGGHTDGQQREAGDPKQVFKKSPGAGPAADFIADKQQQYENTGEKTNIVIGKDREKQAYGVQNKSLIPQQINRSQRHQGQQRKGIQPHNVPLIAQCPGAKAVKRAEDADGNILFSKEVFQENGKKQAGQAQLHRHKKGEELQKPPLRHQNAQDIQRGRQIIGIKAQIVHTQTHIPAVEQTFPAAQGIPEGHEEGEILVVHIGIQNGILAEGLILADEHHKAHSHKGKREGKWQVVPSDLFFLRQSHWPSPWSHTK